MACPGYRTWLLTLTIVIVLADSCQCDLMLVMDRNVSKNFCGRLHCWNQGNLDNNISTVSTISVYDISQPGVTVLLASVPNDGSGMKINQYLISNITGAGSIDGFNAGLSINFKSPQDCEFGSFLCELEYVDVSGHKETMTVEDRASSGNQCTCSALHFQLSKLSAQLENNTEQINTFRQDNIALSTELAALQQNNTTVSTLLAALRQNNTDQSAELTSLRQEHSQLLLEFQNLSNQVSQIQDHLTSAQTSASTTFTTTTHTPTTARSTPAALGSECSKGMSHSSPRIKFLLWGQIPALCDTESDGGGWVVFQRRTKGDVDFYIDWQSYKTGFGTPDTDFWLGNDVIHNLTSQGYNELRIDLGYNSGQKFAQYNKFNVGTEHQSYLMTVLGYNGTAGNSLSMHDNCKFSTYDRDATSNTACARNYHGGWWYNFNFCNYCYLNGVWGGRDNYRIHWVYTDMETLTFTEMKVRLSKI